MRGPSPLRPRAGKEPYGPQELHQRRDYPPYSIEELKDAANLMRGYDLVALNAAGSAHAGGTLSIMDITAALYLRVAEHDPGHCLWEDRDCIIWSTGHKAPSLYLGLAFAGFCPLEDVVFLRKLRSPYQRHPHWLKLPEWKCPPDPLGRVSATP